MKIWIFSSFNTIFCYIYIRVYQGFFLVILTLSMSKHIFKKIISVLCTAIIAWVLRWLSLTYFDIEVLNPINFPYESFTWLFGINALKVSINYFIDYLFNLYTMPVDGVAHSVKFKHNKPVSFDKMEILKMENKGSSGYQAPTGILGNTTSSSGTGGNSNNTSGTSASTNVSGIRLSERITPYLDRFTGGKSRGHLIQRDEIINKISPLTNDEIKFHKEYLWGAIQELERELGQTSNEHKFIVKEQVYVSRFVYGELRRELYNRNLSQLASSSRSA